MDNLLLLVSKLTRKRKLHFDCVRESKVSQKTTPFIYLSFFNYGPNINNTDITQ